MKLVNLGSRRVSINLKKIDGTEVFLDVAPNAVVDVPSGVSVAEAKKVDRAFADVYLFDIPGKLRIQDINRNNDGFDFDMVRSLISNNWTLSITPAEVTPEPTSEAWTRDVVVTLKDAGGRTVPITRSFANKVSIGDTSSAGTASIESTTLALVSGTATIEVSGNEADWLTTETDTLTIDAITIGGETITGGTSVETFTAV